MRIFSYDYTSLVGIAKLIHNRKGNKDKHHHYERYCRANVKRSRNELSFYGITDKLERTSAKLLGDIEGAY